MKKSFFSLFALVSILLAAPSYAAETVEAGKSCDQLGASMMLTDQTGIAVCARETAGSSKLIWKSMSGGGSKGSLCGFAFAFEGGYKSTGKSEANRISAPAYYNIEKCEENYILKLSASALAAQYYPTYCNQTACLPSPGGSSSGTATPNCPLGYRLMSFRSIRDQVDYGGPTSYWTLYYCVKE